MKPFSLFLVGMFALSATCARADVPKTAKAKVPAKTAKLTQVNVCPMTGESSKGSKLAMTYKNYDVHFCCPGCDTSFAKLSAAEKDKKIASALKEQKAAKS